MLLGLAFCCAVALSTPPLIRLNPRSQWTMRFQYGSGWSRGYVLAVDSKSSYRFDRLDHKSCEGEMADEHFERIRNDVALVLETDWVLPKKKSIWVTADVPSYKFSIWRHKRRKGRSNEYHYELGGVRYLDQGRGWSKLGRYLHETSELYLSQCDALEQTPPDSSESIPE